jgi:hypothetical protein
MERAIAVSLAGIMRRQRGFRMRAEARIRCTAGRRQKPFTTTDICRNRLNVGDQPFRDDRYSLGD